MPDIKKILIANRGEIAVRLIRACHEFGITSVAVYSDPDRTSRHVVLADEAYPLGGSSVAESYLNQSRILETARTARVDAIHPGYGFFSENSEFAAATNNSGFIFIGPSRDAIELLGDKTAARKLARDIGIPVIAGSEGSLRSFEEGLAVAETLGYPVLLKAAAGGGGKGMRVVRHVHDFRSAFDLARSEARNAFGDDRVFVEKYVENPRHVEIQILADHHGQVVYLGERECSIQRRHQKVIEEAPSPIVDRELRTEMGEAAVTLARAGKYANAGTVEFLVDQNRKFYFLEMNTRLQVEHPITEAVTGIDLVREQIRIAEGRELSFHQDQINLRGHAIECRIYAEDPSNNFLPSTGKLMQYIEPHGPRVRVDSGCRKDDTIQIYYDPLLAKVITWGSTRKEAIEGMRRALSEYVISGISTTIPFCQFVLNHPKFIQGDFSTAFVDDAFDPSALTTPRSDREVAAALAALFIALESPAASTSNHNQNPSSLDGWKSLRAENMRQ